MEPDQVHLQRSREGPRTPVAICRGGIADDVRVHPDGERRSVSVSRAEVVEHMDSELFEKLTDTICQCEPIGETNVVEA